MKPCFFIFGFGYTAKFLAPNLVKLGFNVVGTTRKHINNDELSNIEFIDLNHSKIEEYLRKATHILISIPPDKERGDIVLSHYSDLFKRLSPSIEWLGYLSSTGVYGNHNGNWVDELSTCNPQGDAGKLRLQSEKDWICLSQQSVLPLHIFRLAGIYGPERNALERLGSGKKYSIYKKDQVFSRVHVEDIASVIIKSIKHPNPISIYNVSDDEPSPSHVVDSYASQLLNKPPLPLRTLEEASISSTGREFYSSNRRVANLKIKEELKVTLKYPSYKHGLNKIFGDTTNEN